MSRESSAEQVLEEHLERMGPDLGPIYNSLWNECAWMHVRWQEYQELYGKGAERVELLNRVGASFFRITQDAIWEGILLQMCALTDAPETFGKPNLSILALPPLIKDEPFRAEIKPLVEAARESTEFARDWRNRRIAHRDLDLVLGKSARPLAEASRIKVSDAIQKLSEVLRRMSLFYLDSDLVFGMIPITRGGGDLLHVLRDGLHLEHLR